MMRAQPIVGLGFAALLVAVLAVAARGADAEVAQVRIAFLSQIVERPPKLSNLDLPPGDEGVAGGRLSINLADVAPQ